jgi:hypothetical protein
MATTFTNNYRFSLPALGDASWGGLRNQNATDVDAELFKPRIGQSALTWGATTTVDLSLARVFTGTNNAISTIAFSNVPATFPNGAVVPFVRVVLLITNGGAFAITWPASVVWFKGAAPEFRASGVDRVVLETRDGGTTWYGEGTFPRFRAFRDNTVQSIPDATDTIVDWQTEAHDVGSVFDPATDKFTIPAGGDAGCWLLHAQVRWINNATGTRRLWIRKNGTTIVAEADQVPTNAISHNQEVSLTIQRPAVGDYFEVLCRQTSTAALNIDNSTVGAYTYFEGTRIA